MVPLSNYPNEGIFYGYSVMRKIEQRGWMDVRLVS